MTTPTPDKGALERARRLANTLAKHFIGEQFAAEDETCSRCVAMVTDALAAAEAKARAAAIAECADVAEALIHYSGINVQDSMRDIVQQIRALATPAQSPSPQTEEPE